MHGLRKVRLRKQPSSQDAYASVECKSTSSAHGTWLRGVYIVGGQLFQTASRLAGRPPRHHSPPTHPLHTPTQRRRSPLWPRIPSPSSVLRQPYAPTYTLHIQHTSIPVTSRVSRRMRECHVSYAQPCFGPALPAASSPPNVSRLPPASALTHRRTHQFTPAHHVAPPTPVMFRRATRLVDSRR